MITMTPAPDHTITVAVGDPDRDTLDAMTREVADALRDTVAAVGATYETHTGEGEWEGEREHSAHVTVYPAYGTPGAFAALTRRLASIAARHGQDGIAYWGSPVTMVRPA